MTNKERDLLLKDSFARLPYGVKGINEYGNVSILKDWKTEQSIFDGIRYGVTKHGWRPYLFPLSSMTEEQEKELEEIDPEFYSLIRENGDICISMDVRGYDWLNKNNFDYRGLIPMGLANDATGKNIY